ncbi:potassium channel family protein [Rhodohalobacter mucosus]|uniref:Potassium transporter n=1 Tax=Rhodohalobacter mucosus TaxID=2079485 RepID=A0A316TZE4_9BACT|nr:NAD-binding protein [Rhodohalobacter mucosus]PWN05466.1 potassium transporter [Rhodohalobacter mucosus]
MGENLIRKILLSLVVVAAIVVSYAEIFLWSMFYLEGQTVTFAQSLQVVVESLTTSGYGGFSPWEHDFLNYFVIWMNFTGVALVFIAFPVFILPYLKDVVSKSAPRKVTKNGHVIICEYSPLVDALLRELNSREQDYVIIEEDEQKALELIASGLNVMAGDPEQGDVLNRACLKKSLALVVHSAADRSISILFSAKNTLNKEKTKKIAILRDETMEEYFQLAGADITISPRQLIGKSLALQIPAISIKNSVEIDSNIELVEMDIEEGSELCNLTVTEANLLNQFRINVIGSWVNGEFITPVPPELTLTSKTRLLVAGDREELEQLTRKAESKIRHFRRSNVLVLGYGISGKAAADLLDSKSIEVTIIDIAEKEGVDVVGDIRMSDTLERGGINDASAVIITIQDDTTALFATLLARKMNDSARIIVRANETDDVKKLYQAGADYVQSLATVSGRMLASCIFDDETSLAAEKQIDLVQLPAGNLAGASLAQNDVRSETGCTILAVIREGEKITDIPPESFTFNKDDEIIIAGTDENIHKFEKQFLK